MPKPKKYERKKNFISRCIPTLIREGRESSQSAAICYNIYDRKDLVRGENNVHAKKDKNTKSKVKAKVQKKR